MVSMKSFFHILSLITGFLFFFSVCIAEERIIESEGSFDVITPSNYSEQEAKNVARREALRISKEQAGIYVESYSKSQGENLTQDNLEIITGEIIQIKEVTYDVQKINSKLTRYIAKVTVIIDIDSIEDIIKKYSVQIQELKNKNSKLNQDYDKLLKEHDNLNSSDAVKLNELYEQVLSKNKTIEEILALTEEIISLNPAFKKGIAYSLQAEIYHKQDRYDKALECDIKYLEYNKENSQAYFSCAIDCFHLKKLEQAMEYIDQAIKLEPGNLRYLQERKYIKEELKRS